VRTALLLLLLGGCLPDFGLEDRRFACPEPPATCGGGQVCYEGFCLPASAIPDAVSLPDGDPSDAFVVPFFDAAFDAPPGVEECHDGIDNNGNQQIDCVDPQCGIAACEDLNVCTDQYCLPNGACGLANIPRTCGQGCQCVDGGRTETGCMDLTDNDGDALIDCRDADCPTCGMLGLGVCCPDGSCSLLTCLL
jgi:hypothetical protein